MAITQVVVSHTALRSGDEAGACLAADVREKLRGALPDVLILFASPQIARAEGQFSGIHNCAAIVCAIPQ